MQLTTRLTAREAVSIFHTVDDTLHGAMPMLVKFSQHIVPLTDLKTNPGRVVKHVAESHRPVLVTSRGRGASVMQSVTEFEAAEAERSFMRAVVAGLSDIEEGREFPLAEVESRLGLGQVVPDRHE